MDIPPFATAKPHLVAYEVFPKIDDINKGGFVLHKDHDALSKVIDDIKREQSLHVTSPRTYVMLCGHGKYGEIQITRDSNIRPNIFAANLREAVPDKEIVLDCYSCNIGFGFFPIEDMPENCCIFLNGPKLPAHSFVEEKIINAALQKKLHQKPLYKIILEKLLSYPFPFTVIYKDRSGATYQFKTREMERHVQSLDCENVKEFLEQEVQRIKNWWLEIAPTQEDGLEKAIDDFNKELSDVHLENYRNFYFNLMIFDNKKLVSRLFDSNIKIYPVAVIYSLCHWNGSVVEDILDVIEERKQLVKDDKEGMVLKLSIGNEQYTDEYPVDFGDMGDSSLKTAVNEGSVNSVRILCNFGANPNQRDRNGNTPLIVAAARNSIDKMEVLLNHGADVNMPNNRGATPLRAAIDTESHQALEKILGLENIKINEIENGVTNLEFAFMRYNMKAVILLMESKKLEVTREKFIGLTDCWCNDEDRDEMIDSFDRLYKTDKTVINPSGHSLERKMLRHMEV